MRELAKIFIAVGTQSVGGGVSTLLLLRRFLIERERRISEREFNEAWALCQLSPGIHLVALAGLLGQRIAGWRGVIVAVCGMMIPAAIITAALTAGYGVIADQPLARAALAGIAPATGGMTLGLAIVLVRGARRHGLRTVVDVALVITAFAVLLLTTLSSVAVIVGVLLKDSALALGGLGSLPMLRQDLVATGVVNDAQLVAALAIGRLSTGPSGLWIVSLGYQIAGPLGAAMALVASSLPPLVILPATAVARRWLLSVPFAGLVRGAALATAGLLCATGVSLIVPRGDVPSWWQLVIGVAAAALTYQGRLHPAVVVIGGALLGLLLAR
jgi:chromate transporter